MKTKTILALVFLGFFLTAKAQDPIFTQYFMVPETLNPGFTGFMETTNMGLLHRTQWPNLDFKVDSDYGFINTWLEDLNSGVGISVLNHRENLTHYNFTQVNLNYAYRVTLSDDWFFRPAIEVGLGNKSYGFQNLVLSDQININQGTISPASIDPMLFQEKVNFFDFSAGMLFNNEEAWFGASLKHLNKPNISFSATGNIPLEMFLSASAGYEFELSHYTEISFLPEETKLLVTANYMQQGEYNRLDFGSGLIFKKLFFGVTAALNPMKKTSESSFLTSVNAFGGLRYEHFKFGYSYDFNTTKIRKTGGIYELSVSYQFDLKVKCFGCPNYY